VLLLLERTARHRVLDEIDGYERSMALVSGSSSEGETRLLAMAMHYGRLSDGRVTYIYGDFAKEPLGDVLSSSYNTWLGQGCHMTLANASSKKQVVSISMVDNFAKAIVPSPSEVEIAPHGMYDYDLCSQDAEDRYGVVSVQASDRNSLVGYVTRFGYLDDYRFSTELRQ